MTLTWISNHVSGITGKGVVAAALVLTFAPVEAHADFHNTDFFFYSSMADSANDYHIVLDGTSPISYITDYSQFNKYLNVPGNPPPIPPMTITFSNGNKHAELTWTFPIKLGYGQGFHAGYAYFGIPNPKITEEYWSLDGTRDLNPMLRQNEDLSASVVGPGTDYVVVRITNYADQAGTIVLGHDYIEAEGTSPTETDGEGGTQYDRIAWEDVGPNPVPFGDLNEDNASLNGQLDAVQGPIESYNSSTGVDAGAAYTPFLRVDGNPVRGAGVTSISFALPRAGRAEVGLYDVAGRLMRLLASQAFAAGEHALQWDGRDTDGGRLAQGVYFVRVEQPGSFTDVRKVVVLEP